MHFPCRPAWACFFFFCLSFCPSALPPPAGLAFPSPGSSAALGFAHNWLSQLQQGRSGALLVSVSLLIPQNCKQGRTRAFSCPGHVIPHFPLRGKAGLFPKMRCPSLPDSLTTAPHGFNRAGLELRWCRFPLPGLQNRTQGHTGPSSFSASFLETPWSWQHYQVPLQVVIHSLLDGANREKQGAVAHLAGLGAHLGWFHINELFFFQPSNVFCNRVGAHSSGLANAPDAGPALM